MRNWSNQIFKSTVNFLGYFVLSIVWACMEKLPRKTDIWPEGSHRCCHINMISGFLDVRSTVNILHVIKALKWIKTQLLHHSVPIHVSVWKKCVLLSLLLIIMQHVWFFKTVPYLFSNTTKKSPSNYELVG